MEFVDEITVEPEEDVETREVVVFDDLAEEEVAPEPEPPATAVNPDAEIDAYSPFRTPPEPVVTPDVPADATTEMTQADLAARISDKCAFFLVGDLIEFGETEQVFSMPKDKRTEDYITGRFG